MVHDAPTLASAPHFKNTSGPATSPGYAIYCSGLPEALPNHIACGGASFSTAAAGVSVCVTSTFINRVLGPPQLTFNCAAARPRALGRTLKHGLAKARGRATHSKTRAVRAMAATRSALSSSIEDVFKFNETLVL